MTGEWERIEFGPALRALRERRALRQRDVADRMGISRTRVTEAEMHLASGNKRKLAALAEAILDYHSFLNKETASTALNVIGIAASHGHLSTAIAVAAEAALRPVAGLG